jgi:hypothetical protein
LRTISLVAAVGLLAACGGVRDAEVRRARLAAERRSLEATLDRLEDRLLVDQARVRFWREMKGRHEGVTAIACASQDQHAAEMAKRLLQTEPRHARRSPLHEARVVARSIADPEPEPEPAPAVGGAAN